LSRLALEWLAYEFPRALR